MGISVYQAQSQQNRLSGMAAEVRSVSSSLAHLESVLSQSWRSIETPAIQMAIQQMARELGSLAYDLESLGDDIVDAAEEIRREEEARARAAARAAEAAAARAAAEAANQQRSSRSSSIGRWN